MLNFDNVFEIMWEENKPKHFNINSVKIKLIPTKGKTVVDILNWYKEHDAIKDIQYKMSMPEVKAKRKETIHLKDNFRCNELTYDPKEEILYHIIPGAHYITQHWCDILPDKHFDFLHNRCNDEPLIRFITVNHGEIDLPLTIIRNYFVHGYKGEMNHSEIGDALYEMLQETKK